MRAMKIRLLVHRGPNPRGAAGPAFPLEDKPFGHPPPMNYRVKLSPFMLLALSDYLDGHKEELIRDDEFAGRTANYLMQAPGRTDMDPPVAGYERSLWSFLCSATASVRGKSEWYGHRSADR
jgi:hypothetical protein